MKEKYDVSGMSCAACVAHVEKAVSGVEGVQHCQVSLLTNDMIVEYDENVTGAEAIIASVEKAGYGASLPQAPGKKNSTAEVKTDVLEEMRKRLISSFVLMMLLMVVSMGHMVSLTLPSFIEAPLNFALTQLLLTLPVIFINRHFFISGFKSLAMKAPNMNALIAIGSGAALVYGIFAMYMMGYGYSINDMELVHHYHHDLYFESASMILTLITLGKYLEERAKRRTTEAISSLMDLSPKTAVVLRNGNEVVIPSEEVNKGDIVVLKPGMMVPVDGMIVDGTTTVDESALTGESLPKEKVEGDTLMSGTLNLSGSVLLEATKVGEDTTLSNIVRLVEEAASSKAPIAQLADKIANYFVPVVILISIVTMLVWYFKGASFSFLFSSGITVLVISCPCALGLATPVALMVSTGRVAKNGILIKSSEAVQLMQEVNTVVLDKTGTITENRAEVARILCFRYDEDTLIRIMGTLENGSAHPLAAAIVSEADRRGLKTEHAERFNYITGKGIEGKTAGKNYYLGNAALLKDHGIDTEAAEKEMQKLAKEGMTPLMLAEEDSVIGIVGVADRIKDTSYEAIEMLHKEGIHVVLLTGDNRLTAEAVAEKLKVDRVVAEVLPDQKEEVIIQLQKEGKKVAMVGDGINDSIALMRADVGLSVKSGSDIAIDAADVVLMKDDLRDVAAAIRLSRETLKVIKQNLFWAFFYNALMIPLAAGVYYNWLGLRLSPMIGSACMSVSSLTVVTNALRLRKIDIGLKGRSKKEVQTEMAVKEEKRNGEKNSMKKVMHIEGMMCENCVKHVSKALNGIEGVSAVVSLEENKADITLDREVSDEVMKAAVEEEGYRVTDIHNA